MGASYECDKCGGIVDVDKSTYRAPEDLCTCAKTVRAVPDLTVVPDLTTLAVEWEPSKDDPDTVTVAIISGRWKLVASTNGDWLIDDQCDVAFISNPDTTGFTLAQAQEKAVTVLRALLSIPGGI